MKKLLTFILIVIAFVTINSCKKNEITTTPDPIVPFEVGKTITAVVAGKVTAQDGTALNNVEITIGSSTTTTDVGGNFIIPKATLGEKVGFIKATKTGYFAGSRTIMAKEKVINNVVIQMIKKAESGSFTNASGGTITVATGGSIQFPANAMVTKSGAAYTGTVKVSAYFLDPTSANCNKEMPGDLRGINTSNNEQVLASYGMMAVELNGSNGEALQLATGKNATLTFPVVSSLQGNAPATIPLWFFDETKGMWIEQGIATKTGNTYVGTVSHFTWWNCDWGGGPLTYTATFVDQNGNPLSNYHVYFITSAGRGGGGGHGWTASDGSLTGNIPANTPIVVKVEGYCGNISTTIYTATVGPFTTNTNAGTITITLANTFSTTTIKGNVVDCNNAAVANGYTLIKINNYYYYTNISNGLFSKTITTCGTAPIGTAVVDVFDLSTLKKNTTPSTVNITGAGVFNVGQVQACGLLTGIHYTASFVDQFGNPLTQYYINIKSDSLLSITYQANSISTILPINKVLTIKVYANATCGGYVLVDSIQIGPFAADFNAGTIAVTVPQANTFTISGTVNTCSNTPVANGYANIVVDNQLYNATITNGAFSKSIIRCSSSPAVAVIDVFDNVNQQRNTNSNSVTISTGNNNIGTMQACGTSTSVFLTYTFNGVTQNQTDSLIAYYNNGSTSISGNSNAASIFTGDFAGNTLGTKQFHIILDDQNTTYITTATNTVTLNVTEYGSVGQFIAGNFTGMLSVTGTSTPKSITGSFRVQRLQ